RVPREGGERYFLLVVDDYTRYTTVVPLHSKAEVRSVLIRWIRAVRRQLSARFQHDLPVLRLHSDRGGEFSSSLLEDFCGAEGIRQTFTLPASPQQNGIAERRIGLVMEVARPSIVQAAAPQFMWSFAVRYAAEQLNLWPRVSHPETSPTLRCTGEVGDALAFRVWGALSLVRDPPARKLSPRTLRCVFLGFPIDAPGWQFYHLGSRRVLYSQDVTFDEFVSFYCLHPHRSSPMPLPPLALVSDPPAVAPLPLQGPAPSCVSQVDPSPLVEPVKVSSDTSGPAEGRDPTPAVIVTPHRSARLAVPPGFPPRPSSPPLQPDAVDSSAAYGGATGGGKFGGAGSGGAECPLGTGGTQGAGAGGPGTSRQEALSPERLRECAVHAGGTGACRQETLSLERLREWAVQWGSSGGGASRARTARAGGAATTGATGGTGGAADVGAAAGSPGGGAGCAGAAGSVSAGPRGAGAGVPGVRRAGGTGTGGTGATGGASPGGADIGGTGAAGGTRGAGIVGASAVIPRVGGTGGVDTGGATGGTGVGGASRQESLSPQQLREWAVRWGSPSGGAGGSGFGGAVATGAGGSGGVTTQLQQSALRHLLSLSPAATEFPVAGSTPPLLFPPTVQSQPQLLPGSPTACSCSSHCDLVHTASPAVTRLLATVVADPNFESTAAFALVAELVDFVAMRGLDYTASLAFYSSCPPSVGGELALGCDILEDRQFELECLAAAAPHLASTLLCPEGDPDAPDIPAPRTYVEAITVPYSSLWQIAMDAEMASWKSTVTYVDEVPPLGANIVDGMWIFRVKWPPGSPLAFKARYVARGFSQHEGVDFFQTFSPTPTMTTLQVLLHGAAQRDYELHSLDFSTAFLQGSLHEAIWLRHPRGFTGSFPQGTQRSLWQPVYELREAPREWHDTLRTTLAALGFAPSTADPSLFLRTDTSLPTFYVLVC
ncbi:unnamed protein product, partial [Closterium sp. NIES-54]